MKIWRRQLTFLIFFLFAAGMTADYAESYVFQTRGQSKNRTVKQGGLPQDLLYQEIYQAFSKKDYLTTDTLCRRYLEDKTKTSHREDILYLQALSLVKLNRRGEAHEKFKELETAFGSDDDKAGALASQGDLFLEEGAYDRAGRSYEEALIKYPNSSQSDYVSKKLKEISPKVSSAAFPFYTVQVGSFSKESNARKLVSELLLKGYDGYLEKERLERHYRVRVGKFVSREKAAEVERRLRRDGYPTKIYP